MGLSELSKRNIVEEFIKLFNTHDLTVFANLDEVLDNFNYVDGNTLEDLIYGVRYDLKVSILNRGIVTFNVYAKRDLTTVLCFNRVTLKGQKPISDVVLILMEEIVDAEIRKISRV